MSKHVHEWLDAYMDGELQGSRLRQVEAHLAECSACQAELDASEKLSRLLKEEPEPQFTSPERFAAQVILQLPPAQPVWAGTRILEIGWWMIPVGLLSAWVFVSTSIFVSDILSAAGALGWLSFGSESQAIWSNTLGQFGILSGNNLHQAALTERITRSSLSQIGLQVSIALLYLAWIAVWWTRQKQEHGQHREF